MNILCFGDSNTWGYKPDKSGRYDENIRWTGLLQKKLGSGYHIIEEGLCGRTTVFQDELREGRRGLDLIGVTVEMHNPIDLMIIMLGTNDTKERFNASPACIGIGMERLALKAETVAAWRAGRPNLLIVAPPHIGAGHNDPAMGASCHAASMGVAEEYRKKCAAHGWAFFDAEGVAEFNTVDYMHLSRRGHRQLADALAPRVRDLT